MSDDIVARLRAVLHNDRSVELMNREAADEIERLRLEVAIPRDEYASEWKNLLDRIEHLDILEWIRAYASAHSPSDYASPIAREVIVRSDKRLIEAADEIERLRRERDEARRRLCVEMFEVEGHPFGWNGARGAAGIAERLGWDCFKEER